MGTARRGWAGAGSRSAAPSGLAGLPADIVEAIKYYTKPRGQQPSSPKKLRLASTGPAVGWDAFRLAERVLSRWASAL
jgi:hypothetical protein